MANRWSRSVVASIAACLLLVLTALVVNVPHRDADAATFAPQAVQRDFAIRYSNNVNGQITIAANTIVKCPVDTTDTAANNACNGSRAGTNARNNNSYDMQWLDYDSDPSTFDSSKADLLLPAGGHVLFAGLYWTGVTVKGDVITYSNGSKGTPQPAPNPSAIGQVKFRVPGSSTYATVNASTIDTGPISLGSGYGAFADVTALVNAAGAGSYYVGNVQTSTGGNAFGGWSLVVAYADPSEPLRNLSVFDGLKVVSGSSTVTIPLSGFKTPSSGTVRTTVGVVAAEGDAGATGDYLMINNNRLTDAVHPANNTENSTIANRGSLVTTKGPDWANQLGYDASLFTADGFLGNNTTKATFTAQTTGDVYAPQAITFATELYSPAVSLTKTVDIADPQPGDVVTYTITATNSSGTASAIDAKVDDMIPGAMTLAATPTVTAGSVSCVPVACDPSTSSVEASFGTLAPGASASMTLQLSVNEDRPLGEVIDNVATLSFVAPDLGLPVSKVASVAVTVNYRDPAIEKSVVLVAGGTATFAIDVTNRGTIATNGAVDVDDAIGVGGIVIASASGTGWVCGTPTTTVSCRYSPSIAAGASAPTLTVVATFGAGQPIENTATMPVGTGGEPTDANSPALLNDSSTATSGVAPYAILVVNKAAVQPEVGLGGSSQFRMITHNQGPATATGTVLTDTVPAGLDVESVVPSQGTCSTAPAGGGATTVECALGPIAVGDDATVVVTVAPRLEVTGSDVVNTVGVVSDITPTPVTDTATLRVREAVDLSVGKVADRATADPGDVIRYTIQFHNAGPVDAPDASIVDHLPAAIASATVASVSGGGTCNVTTGVIDCQWASLASGSSETVVIDATVKSSFDPLVEADVLSKNAVNVVESSSAYDEVDPSDNVASVTVKVLPFGDLAATATGPGIVAPGDSVTLAFLGTNNGPTTTPLTVMTIVIPAGLTISSSPGTCTTIAPNTLACDLGTLTAGGSASVEVVVTAPVDSAGQAYLSTVAITSPVDDPIPENNSDLTPLYSTFAPVVVDVDPDTGPTDGGTEVTIDGDNLTTETEVEFDGVPCAPVWFDSAQRLVCTTGPHPAGPVDVVVRTADGQTSTLPRGFTYVGTDPIGPKYTG